PVDIPFCTAPCAHSDSIGTLASTATAPYVELCENLVNEHSESYQDSLKAAAAMNAADPRHALNALFAKKHAQDDYAHGLTAVAEQFLVPLLAALTDRRDRCRAEVSVL
ncbi:hypothetical protein H4R35_006916, partial [Dimargaris xerosporica]